MLQRSSLLLVAALAVSLAACGNDGAVRAVGDPAADTAAGVQPRTPDEIEREGAPMTPERAAELGVIDTTIQVTEEP
jgi:predicted small lipoprotein YifL